MNNLINIENRAGKIKLNDSVNKDSADQLIDELELLYGEKAVASNMQIGDITCSAENALESVDVEINTHGGSVFEGQRIYNALTGISSRGIHVTTIVNGVAASMGSVILMAGDTRKITQGSRVMIHEASTYAHGDAAHLRTQSNLLESISWEIAAIYSEKANGSEDDMRELMKAETWMDAKQAKELGFVDVIIKNGKESNSHQSTTNNNIMFNKDKDLVAKLEASQAEVIEHEALIAKREAEAVTLSEDLSASNVLVGEHEATIKDLTGKLELSKTSDASATAALAKKAKEAEAKDVEIVEAKKVTDEAVAAKAAEIMQVSAHAAVADKGDETKNKISSDDFWAEYKRVGDEQGLDAKNVWYAENKHRKL